MRGLIFSSPMIRALAAGRKTQTRRPMKEPLVRLPARVNADWPFKGWLEAGVHKAKIHKAGAVAAFLDDEENTLGLKPGEFHFIPKTLGLDALRSNTHLADLGARGKRWTIVPPAGTKLYVKEALARSNGDTVFAADGVRVPGVPWVWSKATLSPMHMPAAAARLILTLSEIFVEPLQSISREDAIAEGAFFTDYGKHRHEGSVDGGKTWGHGFSQKAGWSMVETDSDTQCLGSPQTAFGAFYNDVHAGPNWNLKNAPSPWDENPWVFAYVFSVTNLLEAK